MEEKRKIKKNFIWNMLGTGFNSFNSLFMLIVVTRINGLEKAGIFTLAFSTACILFVVGTYSGRIFQVTDVDKNITDKDYLVNRIISLSLMIICTIFFVFFRGYDTYKSTIFILMGIFKGLEAFSDVIYGILQKKDLLYKVGQSYFFKSLATITLFIIVDIITHNLIIASIVIILVWIIFIAFFDIPSIKDVIKDSKKANKSNVFKIFRSGFFVFAISFLGLYLLNAPKYSIDTYLDDSMQTIFGIIVMPATAIGLFGQFIFHPFLLNIVNLYTENKIEDLRKIIRRLNLYILGVGVMCTIMAYLVGIPILNAIYKIDISSCRTYLTIIIIAATLHNIGEIYVYILTTIRKTFVEFVLYLLVSISAVLMSNILTKMYGIQGATIAYLFIMVVYIIVYYFTANIILDKKM